MHFDQLAKNKKLTIFNFRTDTATISPDFEDSDEEAEVTTVQNIELGREVDEPTTPRSETVTRNESTVNIATSPPRVTIFDNRTDATAILASTTPISTNLPHPDDAAPGHHEEKDNFLIDSFHRKGHFPDFEDLPTNLATAESNQPARVNVRPASSGKDYEYEYIYYYYDDEDDDNSTAVGAGGKVAGAEPKAELTGLKPSTTLNSEKGLNPSISKYFFTFLNFNDPI
jgi:hypothetical protein